MLVLSYKVLGKRNKVLDLDSKQVSYIELIKFSDNTMTTINDPSKVKKIIVKLNSISGEETTKDTDNIEEIDLINVYDKTFKKTEVAKIGNYLKINEKWYKIEKKGINIYNQIIVDYMTY